MVKKGIISLLIILLGGTFIFSGVTKYLSIDIYEENGKTSHNVWIDNTQNSFTFPYSKMPKLINIDAKHVLLAEFTENKSLDIFIYQFNNAPHYLDRKLALEEIVKHQKDNKDALHDTLKDSGARGIYFSPSTEVNDDK